MPTDLIASIKCVLMGHDDLIRRSAGRLFLQCQHCGRETPGWTIGTLRPVESHRRLRIVRFGESTADAPPAQDSRGKRAA